MTHEEVRLIISLGDRHVKTLVRRKDLAELPDADLLTRYFLPAINQLRDTKECQKNQSS